MINCFLKETYPEDTYYILDTIKAREFLTLVIGEASIIFKNAPGWDSYLIIDMKDKTWRNSPSFEWLYRNSPPVIPIRSLCDTLKEKYKIETIC